MIRPVPERPTIPFDAIPILSPLGPDDQKALSPLCELRGYEKGAKIFKEGDSADRIYFLFVGRVKIANAGPDRDVILEILGPGEPVGRDRHPHHEPLAEGRSR